MSKAGQRFMEVSRAKINPTRDIVLSKTQTGSILMAQQIKVVEGKRTHNIFLQGAFEFTNLEGLIEFRDAVNIAIKEMSPKQS